MIIPQPSSFDYNGPYTLSEKVVRNNFIMFEDRNNKITGEYHDTYLRRY